VFDDATLACFQAATDVQSFSLSDLDASSIERDLKVFKTGTFKDSKGRQRTWTTTDLDALASNFRTLRDNGIFGKVPIRVDHSGSAKDVVGWIGDVRRVGNFLHADLGFTEPDAAQKYRRGTYGPRSLEVGTYETNGDNPQTYSPVVMGLAFVDIAAVEGLFGKDAVVESSFVHVIDDKETSPVGTQANGNTTTSTTDPTGKGAPAGGAAHQQGAPGAGAQGDQGTPAPQVSTHVFKLNGTTDESDFAKVQAHITSLEAAHAQFIEDIRVDFVKALVTDGKLVAAQTEATTTFAKSLSPEQFAAWKATQEAAPKLSLFERHGDITNPNGDAPTKTQELRVAEQTLTMLKKSGRFDDESIKKTSAYKKYAELTAPAK
jgi:hypothetical protein